MAGVLSGGGGDASITGVGSAGRRTSLLQFRAPVVLCRSRRGNRAATSQCRKRASAAVRRRLLRATKRAPDRTTNRRVVESGRQPSAASRRLAVASAPPRRHRPTRPSGAERPPSAAAVAWAVRVPRGGSGRARRPARRTRTANRCAQRHTLTPGLLVGVRLVWVCGRRCVGGRFRIGRRSTPPSRSLRGRGGCGRLRIRSRSLIG